MNNISALSRIKCYFQCTNISLLLHKCIGLHRKSLFLIHLKVFKIYLSQLKHFSFCNYLVFCIIELKKEVRLRLLQFFLHLMFIYNKLIYHTPCRRT